MRFCTKVSRITPCYGYMKKEKSIVTHKYFLSIVIYSIRSRIEKSEVIL